MTTKQGKIRPLSTYGIGKIYLLFPILPTTLKVVLPFLRTVIVDFFFLQFSVKFGFKKIPIISVDDKLDESVPFNPQKVGIYLDFVSFWIRPMTFLIERLGLKKAIPYCVDYLKLITQAYREAARVYRFRMTTTNRPKYLKTHAFRTIHFLDPHYLCVPSLHVAIVTLAYNHYRTVFAELNFTQEEQDFYNTELYEGAQRIIETVLYVKQHSVNCIPAALYMIRHILPDSFTIDHAIKSINELFINSDDIDPEKKALIHTHIHFMYEKLLLEGCYENDWTVPVKAWILQAEKDVKK